MNHECPKDHIKMVVTEVIPKEDDKFVKVYDLGRSPFGHPIILTKEQYKKDYPEIEQVMLIPYKCSICGYTKSFRR